MSYYSQSITARRKTVSFVGGTGKKAVVSFPAASGCNVVMWLRVVPTNLDGADQTYSTWVSANSAATPGDADTVFYDEDRTIVSGTTHTVDEQVYKAVGESDFAVFIPRDGTEIHVMVELASLDAAEFEVEIMYSHLGASTQAPRSTVEVT